MRGITLKQHLVEDIIELRTLGKSYSEISEQLRIPQTTIYKYACKVKINEEYLEIWRSKRGGSLKTKIKKEIYFSNLAADLLKNDLTKREKLLVLSALYWGEGSKRDLEIINSDPILLTVFIEMLRSYFSLSNDRLFVYLRIFPGVNKHEAVNYWSNQLKLPISNFIGFEFVEGKKIGKLPYGMCRLRIRKGADILKQINSINKTLGKIV